MSAVVPFDFSAPAPHLSRRRENSINKDAMIGASAFPVLSIKGKVFTLVKDNERKVLKRIIDDEEVPVSSLSLTIVRANSKARVFYSSGYVEGESDGNKPTCFSHDGQFPDADAESPQAKSCAVCPHAVWMTKVNDRGEAVKGTACTVNTRLAVVDPTRPDTPFLLRVPAGSRSNLSDAVKLADTHGKDYNEVVMKVGFDAEAPSPKLTFKPTGVLNDEAFAKVQALYDDPVVMDIAGRPNPRQGDAPTPAPAPALSAPAKAAPPAISAPELAQAIEAPAPKPAPRKRAAEAPKAEVTEAPAPAPKPAAKPATEAVGTGLLSELSALLDATDD